jgi:hypothetical protein
MFRPIGHAVDQESAQYVRWLVFLYSDGTLPGYLRSAPIRADDQSRAQRAAFPRVLEADRRSIAGHDGYALHRTQDPCARSSRRGRERRAHAWMTKTERALDALNETTEIRRSTLGHVRVDLIAVRYRRRCMIGAGFAEQIVEANPL